MVTRCYLCGGTTERRLVTAENWRGDDLALVENVPSWVCQLCGEQYFDAETSHALESLRKKAPSPRRTVQVPVYSFEQADLVAHGSRRGD